MKRSTFLALFAIAPLALGLSACQPDSGSPVDSDMQRMEKPPTPPATPATPAIAYKSKTKVSRTATYSTLWVMDADGTHQRSVYTAPTTTAAFSWYHPVSWAPDGAGTAASPWRISFIESSGTSPGSQRLMRRNITLVNGVPTGSNTQTLVTINTPASDGLTFRGQGWSPSTTNPEIAFLVATSGLSETSSYQIRLVSPAGGSTTTLFSSGPGFNASEIAWSPDGSKIAVYDGDYSGWTRQIRIIDRSTGLVIDTVAGASNFDFISGLDWSRNGASIAFGGSPADDPTTYIYTASVTSSVEPIQWVAGNRPAWSPDGASIAYQTADGIRKLTLATSASTVLYSNSTNLFHTDFGFPDWKR